MQKVTAFLTFKDQAEDAMKRYTTLFSNAKVNLVRRYGDTGPRPKGTFMTATSPAPPLAHVIPDLIRDPSFPRSFTKPPLL